MDLRLRSLPELLSPQPKAPMHRSPHFDPLFDPLTISDREWLAMSEEEFLLRFGNTPLARSGLRRIQQNVRINQEKNEE